MTNNTLLHIVVISFLKGWAHNRCSVSGSSVINEQGSYKWKGALCPPHPLSSSFQGNFSQVTWVFLSSFFFFTSKASNSALYTQFLVRKQYVSPPKQDQSEGDNLRKAGLLWNFEGCQRKTDFVLDHPKLSQSLRCPRSGYPRTMKN